MPPRDKLVWNHVQSVPGSKSGWICNYCGIEKSGAPKRIRAHLLHIPGNEITFCPSVPPNIFELLGVGMDGPSSHGEGIESTSCNPEVLVDNATSQKRKAPMSGLGSQPLGPKVRGSNTLRKNEGWIEARKRNARIEIQRLFIQCNLSFNILRAPQWKKTVNAIALIGESYNGISYETMRDRELKEEVKGVLEKLEPLKGDWKKYGLSILFDGWSDIKKRPIINILVSCCTRTTFLRAIDASNAPRIDARYVFGHIKQAILDVGPENVVQFVAGSAFISKHQSFGKLLLDAFEECDIPKRGYLSKEKVEQVLLLAFEQISKSQVDQIFKRLDADGDGSVSFNDFKAFIMAHPELLAIFLQSYHHEVQ